MKYYKVVDNLQIPVAVNTAISNYNNSFPNQSQYQALITTITSSSAMFNLPLDMYFSVNNGIAMYGDFYIQNFPRSVNGEFNVSSFTLNDSHSGYVVKEAHLVQFIDKIIAEGLYVFAEGTYLWEDIYEEVRKNNFSDLPNRRQSFFLFEDIADCRYYLQKHRNGFGQIVEVELLQTKALFKGDMNLLDEIPNHFTSNQAYDRANKYWRMQLSSKPVYEILFQGTCLLKPI